MESSIQLLHFTDETLNIPGLPELPLLSATSAPAVTLDSGPCSLGFSLMDDDDSSFNGKYIF